MKKKTIALLLSAALLAVMLFAGCSNSEKASGDQTDDQQSTTETETTDTETATETTETETTDTETATETTETSIYDMTREDLEGRKITLTTSEDQWNAAYQDMVDRYSEEFGVEIEVNILPSSTAAEVKKSQFATNELADITMLGGSPSELTWTVADQNLVDLSEEPWVEKLSDISGFTYFDGKLYGLPLASQDYWSFCVNKNVFEACGLEIPTNKEELVASFEVLKENGYIPFYAGAGDSWMCGNITASGIYADMQKDPDLITKFNTNQTSYSESESFKAMLQDVYDWAAAGYFGDNFMAQTWDGMQLAVANDECGVNIGLTSWLTSLDATFGEGTSDKLVMIPYYIGENDTIYASTCVEFYVAKYSENVDVCKHFMNWCTSDENLQIFYDNLGSTSVFKGIASNTLKPAAKQLMEDMSAGKYGVHLAHNSLIQGQDWDTFCALMQEVYMNEMTPEEFCKEYDEFRYSICVALGMEGF